MAQLVKSMQGGGGAKKQEPARRGSDDPELQMLVASMAAGGAPKKQPSEIEPELSQLMTMMNGSSSQLCLLYTSPSPRDATLSRMPSSA